jgi:hypothetical protein
VSVPVSRYFIENLDLGNLDNNIEKFSINRIENSRYIGWRILDSSLRIVEVGNREIL